MNKQEALEILKYHSLSHKDISHPILKSGFLGILRPFKGELNVNNFHQVMKAIRILSDDFRKKSINTSLISAVWGIIHLSRAWALDPNSQLRKNNQISRDQIEQLTGWLDIISYTVMMLLDQCDDEVAFEQYDSFINSVKL